MIILAISPGEGFEASRWRRVLTSGIDQVMIREKQLNTRMLLEVTRRVQALAPGLPVWVNGRLDVALAAGCGLHAPEAYPEIPPDLAALSRTLHDPGCFEARRNARQLLISPVFATPGKGAALGVETLHGWLDALPAFPGQFLALGGVTPANCAKLRHSRLGGVAMIRSLWDSPDPAGVVSRLRAAWE